MKPRHAHRTIAVAVLFLLLVLVSTTVSAQALYTVEQILALNGQHVSVAATMLSTSPRTVELSASARQPMEIWRYRRVLNHGGYPKACRINFYVVQETIIDVQVFSDSR